MRRRRSQRGVRMRFVVGLTALFAVGLLVSASLGDVGPLAGTSSSSTETATTGTASSSTETATTGTTSTVAAPALSTDKVAYTAGDTVVLSGANWPAADSIRVHVADTGTSGWINDAAVTAAVAGTFSASFALPAAFASTFNATATDASGETASLSFSDSSAASPAATLIADKASYVPGGTVKLSGLNWTPAQSVRVHVADTGVSGWLYDADVIAAADGSIAASFALPLGFASTFKATATGALGATASVNILDAFTGPAVPYIVTFSDRTADAVQAAEITASGATDTGSIPPLFMHSITFPSGGAQAGVTALQANTNVVRVEADRSRDTAAAPNDPRYSQQRSLPRIGWDQGDGSANTRG